MKAFAITATAVALSLTAGAAHAGSWGKSRGNGLVTVSPTVGLGAVNVLNGVSVLNGSPILSGNVVSGILSRNDTGILNGIGLGVLSGNKSYSLGRNRR